MAQHEYPFRWMAVAVASVIALLLTHHRWHAGFLTAALVVLHLDFVRETLTAAKAQRRQVAETKSQPNSESGKISSDQSDELAA